MNRSKNLRLFLLSALFVSLLSACEQFSIPDILKNENPYAYYLSETGNDREELEQLFELYDSAGESYESRFIVIQQIMKILHAAGQEKKLNLFLTTYIEEEPEDPFNAYYLLIVAENYREQDALPLAVHYYERIIKNYHDLLVQGRSVHYICLKNLVTMVEEPEVRVTYYKELIARFSEPGGSTSLADQVDPGPTYYALAGTYEELGEWDLAIQAYKNFLKYPDCVIPGNPNAQKEIEGRVAFYDYRDKNWSVESLEELTQIIQYAIYRRDPRTLNRYRAKVNFFAQSWEQEASEANVEEFCSDFGRFITVRLYCASSLDPDSNNREAYLETWGWAYYIRTWYLYFRRIHFPANPEINGRWEWAGIYFGEKPFAGSGGKT